MSKLWLRNSHAYELHFLINTDSSINFLPCSNDILFHHYDIQHYPVFYYMMYPIRCYYSYVSVILLY